MVVHLWNPRTWELRQEDQEFKASLGYLVRPYLNNSNKKKEIVE
jgi:hypothetical protein